MDGTELTRRKVLSSLALAGGTGALLGSGTGALFSDEESFAGNTIAASNSVAGVVDIEVTVASGSDQTSFEISLPEDPDDETVNNNPSHVWLRTKTCPEVEPSVVKGYGISWLALCGSNIDDDDVTLNVTGRDEDGSPTRIEWSVSGDANVKRATWKHGGQGGGEIHRKTVSGTSGTILWDGGTVASNLSNKSYCPDGTSGIKYDGDDGPSIEEKDAESVATDLEAKVYLECENGTKLIDEGNVLKIFTSKDFREGIRLACEEDENDCLQAGKTRTLVIEPTSDGKPVTFRLEFYGQQCRYADAPEMDPPFSDAEVLGPDECATANPPTPCPVNCEVDPCELLFDNSKLPDETELPFGTGCSAVKQSLNDQSGISLNETILDCGTVTDVSPVPDNPGGLSLDRKALVGTTAGDDHIAAGGDVSLDNNAAVVGDLETSGNVTLQTASAIAGNVEAAGNFDVDGSTVVGDVTVDGGDITITDSGGGSGSGSTVCGDLTTKNGGNVDIDRNTLVDGTIDAAGQVNVQNSGVRGDVTVGRNGSDADIVESDVCGTVRTVAGGGNVDIYRRTTVVGDVRADGKTSIQDSNVGGNVLAFGDTDIPDSVICGNVVAKEGGAVDIYDSSSVGRRNGSVVGGKVVGEGGDVDISHSEVFAVGQSVGVDNTGPANDVTITDDSVIKATVRQTTDTNLDIDGGSRIEGDVVAADGTVSLSSVTVEGTLDITGSGADVDLDNGTTIRGDINVEPGATLDLGDVTVEGDVYAKPGDVTCTGDVNIGPDEKDCNGYTFNQP